MTKHKTRITALIFALIIAAGLLSGCTESKEEETPPPVVTDNPESGSAASADDRFTLNCSRDTSFNPFTAENANNLLCAQLMYDMVCDVDSSFDVSSKILKSWESENGVNWKFFVDTSVKFWDGSTLTADDVAYSIQRGKASSLYKARLSSVQGVSVVDEESFAVTLSAVNTQFPALLTVPVIKNGSIEESVPTGTGPYRPDSGLTELSLFEGHKDSGEMPLDKVYLVEKKEVEDAISAFENAEIDLVSNDPTGIANLGYATTNEIRYYPTTNMHYIGFNSSSRFFSRDLCRKAMTYVINRELIASDIMKGAATEAALPMNPVSKYYNDTYSEIISYSTKKSMEAFDAAEVQDYDDDGLREIMITGIPVEVEITFIVCSDNAQKVAAAQSIADNMTDLGINVLLKALSWSEYSAALSAGYFDMYYAETKMTADFDPGVLMLSGEALNYGRFSSSALADNISAYMSAAEDERQQCADQMFKYITETAPIVTVCFEKHQVISHRGVISGMKPTQYSIFQNLKDWTVDLS